MTVPAYAAGLPDDRSDAVDYGQWIMPNPRAGNRSDAPQVQADRQIAAARPPDLAGRRADVIVCVHNALQAVDQCLSSVIPTLGPADRIILVDDCSDAETAAFLARTASDHPENVHLIRSSRQKFYTQSANLALAESDAELSILLNSDTIVPAGWLDKLTSLAFMDARIGIVGPLSNAAHYQSIPSITPANNNSAINPLPPGLTVQDMDMLCGAWSAELDLPLAPSIHGFCFGIRKQVRRTIGLFDAATFPQGYGEENDYSYRAVDAGFKLLIATNVYVFHAKSQSYPDEQRIRLMQASFKALVGRYPGRVQPADWILKHHPILQAIRERARKEYPDNSGQR